METATVKEIHDEVDSACEALLQGITSEERQRVQVLLQMGFKESENIKDFDDRQIHNQYALAYQSSYPYKFISDYQLRKISAKYGLITDSIGKFVGDIPLKNLNEMEGFKVHAKDLRVPQQQARPLSGWATSFRSMYEELDAIQRSRVLSRLEYRSPVDRIRSFQRTPFDDFHERALRDHEKRMEINPSRKAPVSLSDLNSNPGYQSCVSITAHPELFRQPARDLDPIVTVAVRGGHLIVTAWGAEASDPDVINHSLN